jgi:FMN phosphatase YigB (HAD superfamily)
MASTWRHTALVDLDGVIFKSKRSLSVVENHIVRWVKKKADVPTLLHANEINRRLYTAYGHTYPGVKYEYPNADVTFEEFNREVYSTEMLAEVYDIATSDPETKKHKADFEAFLKGCTESDISVYILTNGPRSWASLALSTLSIDNEYIDDIFCSDDPAAKSLEFGDECVLKPSIRCFATAAKRVVARSIDKPAFSLVDDSKVSCAVARGILGWSTFEFDGEKHALSTDVLKWIKKTKNKRENA